MLEVIVFVIDVVATLTSKGSTRGRHRGHSDLYEINLKIAFTPPRGTRIKEEIKENRPDLRTKGLPSAGDSVIVLYLNDKIYKVL